MPNWCNGYIRVKGKPENVEKFCKLFIFDEEANKDEGKKGQKYFARSFVHQDWKSFKKDMNYQLRTEQQVYFNVDFAWSGYSCLIEGYPTAKDNKNCVTLEWACKKYDVEVKITTEEGGMGFEEEIIANKKGLSYDSKDMPTYKCYNCGNKQQIPTNRDLEDVEFYECGKYAFVDELTEIVKEKMKMIKEKKEI